MLLPLVNTADGISVLFEVRAAKLGWQPGDVCFPGGRAECSDDSFAATALRETCEELGLDADDVQLIGGLNYLVTHMGPIIHPYVGCIKDINKINFNKDWPTRRARIFRLTCFRASRANGASAKVTAFIFTNTAATSSGV